MTTIKRYKILDCSISAVDTRLAFDACIERINSGEGGYVCFSNVHAVVTARKDLLLRRATNNAFIASPDGRPLSVVGKWRGVDVQQVAGPDFLPYMMEHAADGKHFFMGSTEDTLVKLKDALGSSFPQADIVGLYSPPFGPMSQAENNKIHKMIVDAGANIVWVGLGAPKQECWMADNWQQLRPALLFGVGAAFDFHAGKINRAPEFMRRSGLEWLHRLFSEPKRLWKRYLVTNSLFIFYLCVDGLSSMFKKHGSSK
ncbi:WecB/TagA/CpsF family glycosyltransferase [Oceanicoccus sp. KOV_DT_Chl]|uniref:WecB/TagA/CpsF family glycosyltransferase n=1 Tax=Oceanicoccus sp. KOV_DT_Chl TaxID=1904639 RepID=UPI000C7CDC85|nr:WecB/TagA/CpsF family glycosyltransferase [Oceanicoccus sp. KOV_DT_Chl]